MMTSLLPRQVLAKVKPALCRDMRKPSDVKVCQHYQHLTRVNNEEITGLPPAFHSTQKLSDEEMMDVILFGTPRAWQNEMDRQGFDPIGKTPAEVIAFMENIEATEDRPDISKKSNTTNKKETKKPKKSENSGTWQELDSRHQGLPHPSEQG